MNGRFSDPAPAEPERIRGLVAAQPVLEGAAGAGLSGVLGRLCRAAADDLQLSGATITLLPTAGTHTIAAASTEGARRIEELQFDAGEGPTGEAARTSAPVLVPDLVEQNLGRWPGFVEAASAADVGAAFALPLHLGASRFGTLTLYRTAAVALKPSEMRAALIYADIAVELLVDSSLPDKDTGQDLAGTDEAKPHHAGLDHPAQVTPDLSNAFDAQSHIYQAQGMVMVQLGISLPESLARMRAHAYAQGMSLAILATGIIQGTTTVPKGDE